MKRGPRDRATRGDRPLSPSSNPCVGDVLWIMGTPFTLRSVVSAGGRSRSDFHIYRFVDPKGNEIDISKGGSA